MDSFNLLVIIITLLLSAFFSGMEIAFVSSNKLKIELDKKLGYWPARIFSTFSKKPSRFISTMLVGNNIALVIYGIMMALVLEPYITDYITASEVYVLTIQTIISTILVLIAGEFIPKTIFRINPNTVLNILAFPVLIFYVLLYPLVVITFGISKFILKAIFNMETSDERPEFSKVDLDHYVKEATSDPKTEEELEHEVHIFQNALDFSHVKVRECMIPRTDIIAVDVNTPVEEVNAKFVETGLSKILVYRESVDNVIGYVHSFELFRQPEKIKNILLPIMIVPETMPASELLELFIKKKRGIAVVVDEFGGTAGMLTIEDVVEEIFGEIEDEHDQDVLVEKQLSESEFELSARLEIDYVNEKFNLNLPESDEYETIAGLIINTHESIPVVNERIKTNGFLFTVKQVSDNRIELVKLKVVGE